MIIRTIMMMADANVDGTPLPKPNASSSEISTLLGIVFAIVGAMALLMVVVSGFRYILSSGDSRKAAQAKEVVVSAMLMDQPFRVPLKVDVGIGSNWMDLK